MHSGEYIRHFPRDGTYQCAGCGRDLYAAVHKMRSNADHGWPAFTDSLEGALNRHGTRKVRPQRARPQGA